MNNMDILGSCLSGGSDISITSFGEQRLVTNVHVTNCLPGLLTADILQSLALSLPSLHRRLTGTTHANSLVNFGYLQVWPLPFSTHYRPSSQEEDACPTWSRSQSVSEDVEEVVTAREVSEGIHASELLHSFSGEDTTFSHPSSAWVETCHTADSKDQDGDSESEAYFTCSSPSSLGEDVSGEEEWSSMAASSPCSFLGPPEETTLSTASTDSDDCVSVEYQGRDFLRVFSPVSTAEGEENLASWCVTDYTEHGELVFSVRTDFIKNLPRSVERKEGEGEGGTESPFQSFRTSRKHKGSSDESWAPEGEKPMRL
ncbi:hypothetical protein EOD39_4998 [Acipenser ruthenus]|uniref:Uncharacterized protein n=1 Tax=Acipenser ruthenus TaxID=7906 RepID=A0A444UFY9_ACIRT|nr:hypothetical protein EOD39_4998 [Acipenser ruthenus]